MFLHKESNMAKIKIIFSTEIHFIEGNSYNLYIVNPTLTIDKSVSIPVIVASKEPITDEKINALTDSLRAVGAEVEIEKRIWNDPNFETEEEAMEYLANRGC